MYIRIREWFNHSRKNDKYHTFGLTIYYEVDKPKNEKKNIKKMGKKQKKTRECLDNIRIRFPT